MRKMCEQHSNANWYWVTLVAVCDFTLLFSITNENISIQRNLQHYIISGRPSDQACVRARARSCRWTLSSCQMICGPIASFAHNFFRHSNVIFTKPWKNPPNFMSIWVWLHIAHMSSHTHMRYTYLYISSCLLCQCVCLFEWVFNTITCRQPKARQWASAREEKRVRNKQHSKKMKQQFSTGKVQFGRQHFKFLTWISNPVR